MSQREFGYAVGSSHRTAARWDAGRSVPAVHNLQVLARLLHPEYRELAIEVADAADETLESLGLEAPPPPPLPPHRAEDLLDVVVLAAVEQGAPVATARGLLHAVFKRAAESFGEDGSLTKILVVPALPLAVEPRRQSIELLRAKGIDAVIPFHTILGNLMEQNETNRNYQTSDLLQMNRVLKNYDFFKEPQLELFKAKRTRKPKASE